MRNRKRTKYTPEQIKKWHESMINYVKSGDKNCIDCGIKLVYGINWNNYYKGYRCIKCRSKKNRDYYWNSQRDRKLEGARIQNLKFKIEVLSHYSGNPPKCANCGESEIIVLSIDHINGDGSAHRKELRFKLGSTLYRWLKKNNYPAGFQVLCMNCQYRKRWKYHETRKRREIR